MLVWILRLFHTVFESVSMVGCFGLNGPLRQYFSLYRAVTQREGEREEKRIDETKIVQTTPTRTYHKRSRLLPYCNPNCRTPRHCKFTQHHCTTRPPPSLYRTISERRKKRDMVWERKITKCLMSLFPDTPHV